VISITAACSQAAFLYICFMFIGTYEHSKAMARLAIRLSTAYFDGLIDQHLFVIGVREKELQTGEKILGMFTGFKIRYE
jgi:hypothetical protein